ncbi:MAG TPA: hypothetical protein VIX19_10725 [Terriglobales bacterium]
MPKRLLRFVTLSGVAIDIVELKWPFRASSSGSDWLVLHGRVDLLGSDEGLHAEVSIGMTQTMKDALGSLAEEHAESLVVNSIRKTIDNGQLALLKSGKLQPVHVTSRFYSFSTKKIQFPAQTDADVQEFIKHRVFWLSARLGQGAPIDIADPYDCQYVNFSREKMIEMAQQLAAQDLIRLQADHAVASPRLLEQEPGILAAMHKGVEAGKAATKVTA